MPLLQFLSIVLLLSASSLAQEADVAAPINNATDVNLAVNQPVVENPQQPTVPENSTSTVVTDKQGGANVQPNPPAATNETASTPLEVEDPQIAAKQIKGSPGLEKTPQAVLPDAVDVKIVLGARCSSDKDCLSIANSNCIDGGCICKADFIPSKHSMDKCVKVPSGVGDACEEDAQCNHAIAYSECRDSKCDCPLNYVLDQNRCWEKQMLGGICNNTIQCFDIMFAICEQGVCACESPLIPTPINKCLQPAGELYQAPCVEDIQCTHSYGDEARCSNSQCRCTNNYHYNGTKCIADKKLGEACLVDADCAVVVINNEEDSRGCLNNSCTCAEGFSNLSGEEICTKSSAEELAVSLTWIVCIFLAKYYLV